MGIPSSAVRVLSSPSPALLWRLRNDLLEQDVPASDPIFPVIERFHMFLNHLVAAVGKEEYQQFASLLDMGAVGSVVVQNLLAAQGADGLWQRLLADGIHNNVLAMASRAHVQTADLLTRAIYEDAAWFLYEEIWRLSAKMRPGAPEKERRLAVEKVMARVRNPDLDSVIRAVLISYLFEIVLVTHICINPEIG